MSFHAPTTPVFLKGPVAFLPPKTVSNDDLIAWMGRDIRASWIEHRTGIRERHWVEDDTACSDLAASAAEKLLADFPDEKAQIRQLIVATISGDYPTPPTSPLVQNRLGLQGIGAFDLGAACAGFTTGLHTTSAFVAATGQTQLLIASDIRSKFLSKDDMAATALFGDGAAACILSKASQGASFRYVASQTFADGSVADIISIQAGGSRLPYLRNTDPNNNFLKMQKGAILFVKAAEGMAEAAQQFLAKLSLTTQDIAWVVPHQANLHLVRDVSRRLGVDESKVIETVQTTGNTSGASVGIALAQLRAKNVLQAKEKVLLVSAGGGGLAACALLEAH